MVKSTYTSEILLMLKYCSRFIVFNIRNVLDVYRSQCGQGVARAVTAQPGLGELERQSSLCVGKAFTKRSGVMGGFCASIISLL